MTKPARCECRICKLLRAVWPMRAKATIQQRNALDAILVEWECASTSAAYWELKFKGTWPG